MPNIVAIFTIRAKVAIFEIFAIFTIRAKVAIFEML